MVLGLGACASGGNAGSSTDSAASSSNSDKKDITIGVFNGWPEGEAASYVWKSALEKKGYTVTLKYADAGPAFAGLAQNDFDVILDGWLPNTHKTYMEKFGKQIVDLGIWNNDAKLTIAVNKDAPIDSLEDLAANASKFDNRIVGIEPGAGLTEAVKTKVIPDYGLEKMDFITSSTPAMLSELKKAIDEKKDIAVTLWRPQWAYDAFPIKDLKDPKKALGETEGIHTLTRLDFAKDSPVANGWLKNFKMPSDLLFSLENVMYNGPQNVKDFTPIVDKWMSEHKEFADGLTK